MGSLPVILATDLLHYSEDEMFAIEHELFELHFIDGVMETTKARTIWSWLLWDIHRQYPDTPLSIKHHIGQRNLTPMLHANILSIIKTDCKNLYQDLSVAYSNMMSLNRVVHSSFNNMYNVLTYRLQEYVFSISSLDIVEVIKHPRIAEINDSLTDGTYLSAARIDRAHRDIEKILRTNRDFDRNPVAIAIRNNLVKPKQLLQCISARGYMSEVNGQNFRVPMLTSYTKGMRTLSAYAMDSRTASISAFAQESTMRSLQYQNRSFQILNSDIRNIHHVDCGTTTTTEIFIDTMDKLSQYVGIYHMVDNKWKVIDTTDSKLIDTPIRMRTIADCIYPDRHGFCAKCFGDLATSMIDGDKIGQQISAHVQSKLSQGALSVKHFTSNSHDLVYMLSTLASQFFSKDPRKHTQIMVNPILTGQDCHIVFNSKEVENINNLDTPESIATVSINRFTKVTSVRVEYPHDGAICAVTVDIESGTKTAALTKEALLYLLKYKWVVDDFGNYKVDMSHWDKDKPFLQVPRKKEDTVMAGKRFDSFLKGVPSRGKGENDSIKVYTSFGAALMAFQDLTIEHIPMRVSHMQVIMYGLLANNPLEGDYRLPDPENRKDSTFVAFRDKLNNGNIAVAMSYERQGGLLMDPSSFVNKMRSPSDFEYFVIGSEKLK